MKLIKVELASRTLISVLHSIYRKDLSTNDRYEKTVMEGLVELELVKKVVSPKGLYYFKTEKSKNFKPIDFAIEFLWNFHNARYRKIIDGVKYILCYDSAFDTGKSLVEVKEAILKKIV